MCDRDSASIRLEDHVARQGTTYVCGIIRMRSECAACNDHELSLMSIMSPSSLFFPFLFFYPDFSDLFSLISCYPYRLIWLSLYLLIFLTLFFRILLVNHLIKIKTLWLPSITSYFTNRLELDIPKRVWVKKIYFPSIAYIHPMAHLISSHFREKPFDWASSKSWSWLSKCVCILAARFVREGIEEMVSTWQS